MKQVAFAEYGGIQEGLAASAEAKARFRAKRAYTGYVQGLFDGLLRAATAADKTGLARSRSSRGRGCRLRPQRLAVALAHDR